MTSIYHKLNHDLEIQEDMSHIERPLKILQNKGKGNKVQDHPYGEGNLEELYYRRSHMRGRRRYESQVSLFPQ